VSRYLDLLARLDAARRGGVLLGLDRMHAVLAALGSPERRYVTVQIAGTNGKGSTAAMTDAVLRAAGIRTGLYTSPHLCRFTERFDLPYDSLFDPDGKVLLAFHGTLSPSTIPAFVVFDRQGRIAGRILGEATTATLYGVVEDVLGRKLPS